LHIAQRFKGNFIGGKPVVRDDMFEWDQQMVNLQSLTKLKFS